MYIKPLHWLTLYMFGLQSTCVIVLYTCVKLCKSHYKVYSLCLPVERLALHIHHAILILNSILSEPSVPVHSENVKLFWFVPRTYALQMNLQSLLHNHPH